MLAPMQTSDTQPLITFWLQGRSLSVSASLAGERMTGRDLGHKLLPMSKDVDWPHEAFSAYLNDLMLAAGIPTTRHGTPNTVVLQDLTGIDPTQVSRWRKGRSQPTRKSLRQLADGLSDLVDEDPVALAVTLEVHAGLTGEDEARHRGVPEPITVEPKPVVELRRKLREASDDAETQWILHKVTDLNEQIDLRRAALGRG